MLKCLAVAIISLGLIGCTEVEFSQYRGEQIWPVGSGFVKTVEGFEVYEGLPDREYDVVGLADVHTGKPFYKDSDAKRKVIDLATEHKADALVLMNARMIQSGDFLKAGNGKIDTAVKSGSSSQPEILVTHYRRDVEQSYKICLRSSLLLIRWK